MQRKGNLRQQILYGKKREEIEVKNINKNKKGKKWHKSSLIKEIILSS